MNSWYGLGMVCIYDLVYIYSEMFIVAIHMHK